MGKLTLLVNWHQHAPPQTSGIVDLIVCWPLLADLSTVGGDLLTGRSDHPTIVELVPQLGDNLDWRIPEIPTRSVSFEVAQ